MYEIIGRNKFEPFFPNIKWDFGCVCVFTGFELQCRDIVRENSKREYMKIAREKN